MLNYKPQERIRNVMFPYFNCEEYLLRGRLEVFAYIKSELDYLENHSPLFYKNTSDFFNCIEK